MCSPAPNKGVNKCLFAAFICKVQSEDFTNGVSLSEREVSLRLYYQMIELEIAVIPEPLINNKLKNTQGRT